MTQKSYPLTGQPFTDDQYGNVFDSATDGILDDWYGPYTVTVNTNDTVTVNVASNGLNRAVVSGYMHTMDANEILSVPAVTAQTRYNVGLLYDPTNATLPVRLAVLKGVTPNLSNGKKFLPIITFDRAAGQTLPGSVRNLTRPRRAPTITVDDSAALEALNPLLFLKGTIALDYSTGAMYRAAGSLTAARWVNVARADELGGYSPGQPVASVVGESTVLFRAPVTVPVDTVVDVVYAGQAQSSTPDANWAGTLDLVIDGSARGKGRRYQTRGGEGSVPLSLDRRVSARLAAGSHTVAAVLYIEPNSNVPGRPSILNSLIEVWAR